MPRKKTTAKKKDEDFYSNGLDFSDDPQDSFYATEDDDGHELAKHASGDKKTILGFYLWESGVLAIEILLVTYVILVFLGLAPLI